MTPVSASRCEWQLPATCGRSSTTRTSCPACASARPMTAPLNPAPTMQYLIPSMSDCCSEESYPTLAGCRRCVALGPGKGGVLGEEEQVIEKIDALIQST